MTGNETACKMGVISWFVKSPSTQLLLTNESRKTHLNRRCWHFCCHCFGLEARVGLLHSPSDQQHFIVPRSSYLAISWRCSDRKNDRQIVVYPAGKPEANSWQIFRLRLIEFRFPLSQRRHHRGEIGRLAEEHFLHPGIVFAQRADAFIGRVDLQRPLHGLAIFGPRRFEEQALVLRDSPQQFQPLHR